MGPKRKADESEPWQGITESALLEEHCDAHSPARGKQLQYSCRSRCIDWTTPVARSRILAHVRPIKHWQRYRTLQKIQSVVQGAGKVVVEDSQKTADVVDQQVPKKSRTEPAQPATPSSSSIFQSANIPEATYTDPSAGLPPQLDLGGMDTFDFNANDSDDDSRPDSSGPTGPPYRAPPPPAPPGLAEYGSDYWPWPSREFMLTDLLVNSADGRISQAAFHRIIAVMKEITPAAIPSLYQLKRFHEALKLIVPYFVPAVVTTKSGRTFHRLPPADAVHAAFSTPHLRKKLSLLPEEPTGATSSINHANKALHPPDASRAPMVSHAGLDYYYDELAQTVGGDYVFLCRFFTRGGFLMFEAHSVEYNAGVFSVGISNVVAPVSTLRRNSVVVTRLLNQPNLTLVSSSSPSSPLAAVSPLRLIAKGRKWYMINVAVFADDLSGTGSKRMNPHFAASIQLLALPPEHRRTFCSFSLYTISKHATPLEIVEALQTDLDATLPTAPTPAPLEVYDIHSGTYVLVSLAHHIGIHDGPMRSVLSSTTTCGHAAHPCCQCVWGGQKVEKRSAIGLSGFLRPPAPRTPSSTRKSILDYLDLATQPLKPKSALTSFISQTGVVDVVAAGVVEQVQHRLHSDRSFAIHRPRATAAVKDSAAWKEFQELSTQEQVQVKDEAVEQKTLELCELLEELLKQAGGINPLLSSLSGFDPHLDLPPEPLHVLLLGIVKYLWRELVKEVKALSGATRLVELIRSFSHLAISDGPFSGVFWVQYPGTLVGRDLKIIAQVAPYLALLLEHEELLSSTLSQCWQSVGRLLPALFVSSIPDIGKHSTRLHHLARHFLHLSLRHNANFVILKIKYHDLLHLIDAVARFGPNAEMSAEGSEALNKVWRARVINSNQQATSRDVTESIGRVGRLRFLVSGGEVEFGGQKFKVGRLAHLDMLWPETRQLVCELLSISPAAASATPPSVNFVSANCDMTSPEDFATTVVAELLGSSDLDYLKPSPARPFRNAVSCRAANEDLIRVEQFALVEEDGQRIPVQIVEIVAAPQAADLSATDVMVAAVRYRRVGQVDKSPFIRYERDDDDEWGLYSAADLLCAISAYHDCRRDECSGSTSAAVFEERRATSQTVKLADHGSDPNEHIILNTCMFRSFWLIDPLRPPDPAPLSLATITADVAIEPTSPKNKNKNGSVRGGRGGGKVKRRRKPSVVKVVQPEEEEDESVSEEGVGEESGGEKDSPGPVDDISEQEEGDSSAQEGQHLSRAIHERVLNRQNGDISTDPEEDTEVDEIPRNEPANKTRTYTRRPSDTQAAAGALRTRKGKRESKVSAKLAASLAGGR